MSEILNAREKRANHIQELMKEYKNKTIVILKANVPGVNKNPKNMVFICRYFCELMNKTFKDNIIKTDQIKSLDGDYVYYIINSSGNVVKEKTILIEEKNLLGRLVDIDVFNDSAITFRITAKTTAGSQWSIQREIIKVIKTVFDKEKIEIPYKYINLINVK